MQDQAHYFSMHTQEKKKNNRIMHFRTGLKLFLISVMCKDR